jgi:carbamoyltransferase
MLLVAGVREGKRRPAADSAGRGLERVREVRSVIPAVTHVDYSARLQTVDKERNPRLRRLLEAFERRTGCPVMINTSFNIRNEPIVCTPADALRCFLGTKMDALVIGDFVLLKEEQPPATRLDTPDYLGQYEMD